MVLHRPIECTALTGTDSLLRWLQASRKGASLLIRRRGTFLYAVSYIVSEGHLRRDLPMNLLHNRAAAIRLGIACAALLASTLAAPCAQAEEVVKSYTVAGRANVQVNSNDGGVRIT